MAEYNFDEIIERHGTQCIKHDFNREYFGTDDIIPMWVADMDFRTPDFVMEAIRKRTEHEIMGYTKRSHGFFQAIINWYKRRQNWSIEPDWIIFTPGIVPALHFSVRAFTSPGDKIIIQPPVYHPFFSVIEENQREILINPLTLRNGKYYMNLDNLKDQLDDRVKLMLLCHPHNPVGRNWTPEELTELGNICLERNILIISDEIHSDLILPGQKHVPLAAISSSFAEITITCIAPSKTFNLAGLSTAVVVISDSMKRKVFSREIETSHLWVGNIFGNIALEAAYRNGDGWLDQLMNYLLNNFKILDFYLKQFIPEIKLIWPEATYLAWLNMSGLNLDEASLKYFMIHKAGLGCNDGSVFGPGGQGFQRMNIACPKVILNKSLDQLRHAVKHL
jgi:cysteine-S-conjugate beta-lyase